MAKAKAKTEEVKEEVKEEKKTKVAGKKADQVVIDEFAGVDIAAGEDQTVETYARATPFGIEVWDPETKSTTFKANG